MNKKLKNAAKDFYDRSSLTSKIRYSYLVILIPIFLFLLFCFYNLWAANYRYQDMINSTVAASEFTLDFKKDFDYETYLLIVGNKTVEESELRDMLTNANRIITGLEQITDSRDNLARLKSIKKYLNNLDTYVDRIEQNIRVGNRYEDNMEIWENDVQIVTTLVRETIFQYIYYETKGIQESHAEYQSFFVSMIEISVIAFVAVLLLIAFISHYIPLSISRPITELVEVTQQVSQGNLQVRSHVNTGVEAKQLSESLNTMIDKINELLEQVKKEQIRIRKAEFELLQAQINPHFLYNTLDTIYMLARINKEETTMRMIQALSKYLRLSLSKGEEIVTVADELENVRNYMEIQQIRNADLFRYEIHCEVDADKERMLKLVLQPLVENAIKYGFDGQSAHYRIEITVRREEEELVLTSYNSGTPISPEACEKINCLMQMSIAEMKESFKSKKNGYGLVNVLTRLRLAYEGRVSFYVIAKEDGTTFVIRIPRLVLDRV